MIGDPREKRPITTPRPASARNAATHHNSTATGVMLAPRDGPQRADRQRATGQRDKARRRKVGKVDHDGAGNWPIPRGDLTGRWFAPVDHASEPGAKPESKVARG